MPEQLNQYLDRNKALIENTMKEYLDQLNIPERLKASMSYSLEAGGKRLRPILLIASYETYATDIEKVLSSAIALEMIHTYSLIHDDLPAMDNDDYRRGKLTNHKVYDEATAILAGDALLTHSFEIIANDPLLSDNEKVHIINALADASGPKGMVAGQILDMEAEEKLVSINRLERIHTLKTGALISFAVTTGAFLAKVDEKVLAHLQTFAHYLGLIFQVQDDILDVTGEAEKIGKPVGSDAENEKSTYPIILGLDGAIKHKNEYVRKAEQALTKAAATESMLMDLMNHFSQRDY